MLDINKLFSVMAVAVVMSLGTNAVRADGPVADLKLYRLYKGVGNDADRLYTTDSNEAIASGYRNEGFVGKCFSTKVSGTSPLYRLHSSQISDHLYTTNEVEKDAALRQHGYTNEGVTCYVYTDQKSGTCPLFRLFAGPPKTNHFYTLSPSERGRAISGTADVTGPGGGGYAYRDEGIAAFVVPELKETCPG